MATKSNLKHVKAYEKRMTEEKGPRRQKVWIPDTPKARKQILEYGEKLRKAHLKKLGY